MQLGNLNLMILKSISESEKYGLEIIDDISKKTNGNVIVKQPSLYSGLRRLEQRGLISSRWEDSELGGRRHYYTITNLGASELRSHDTENLFTTDAGDEQKQAEKPTEVTPHEIPVENVFESKDDVAKRDEQTALDLERSFDEDVDESNSDSAFMEKIATDLNNDEPVTSANEEQQVEAYEPEQQDLTDHKSFSENMKEYVEPQNSYDEYKLQDKVSENVQEDVIEQQENNEEIVEEQKNDYSAPQDTVVEYVNETRSTGDDINYKDILGDLDADLNKQQNFDETVENDFIESKVNLSKNDAEVEQTTEQTESRPKSAYQKELEEILLSSKQDDATHSLTLKETDRMAEVNRKYGDNLGKVEADEIVEDETFDENIHRITPKDVGFTYLNQEDITVKPYKKSKRNKSNVTGLFLSVNRYNLIRASIMFVLMALELLVSYLVCNANGVFDGNTSTAVLLYSISTAIIVLYFCITLIYTLSNYSKKIKTESISFMKDFLYRFIMCVFVVAFIFGLNIFMGMPNTISWLLPCVMAANILISWLVGLIMYKTKNFHA